MPPLPANYIIRQIEADDGVKRLNLRQTDRALAAYLQKDALVQHNANVAKTYVCVDPDCPDPRKIRAFITIGLGQVLNEIAEIDDLNGRFKNEYPAVRIGRLATDDRYEGQGMAGALVKFVIALVKREIMPRVGCRFLFLDANPPSIDWYKAKGFTILDTPTNLAHRTPLMFMDLHKLA